MDKTTIIVGVVIVAAVLIGAAAVGLTIWIYLRKQQTERLHSKFGTEYDRLAAVEGNRGRAEKTLHEREKRVKELDLIPLPPEARNQFAQVWQQEQSGFVDDPRAAVANADRLVAEIMKMRGYPIGDFEQRAADISVDHASVVTNYRIAHDIALRDRNGGTSTEELRTALLHYRTLFEELLEVPVTEPEKPKAAAVGT
jgi:hypothetical protein